MSLLQVESVRTVPADIKRIVDRARYYSNKRFAFGVLRHGTCFFPRPGEPFDREAQRLLNEVSQRPIDFTVREMDDHNIIVRFGEHLFGIVLRDEFDELQPRLEQDAMNAETSEKLVGLKQAPKEHLLMGLLARTRLMQDLDERKVVETVQAGQ